MRRMRATDASPMAGRRLIAVRSQSAPAPVHRGVETPRARRNFYRKVTQQKNTGRRPETKVLRIGMRAVRVSSTWEPLSLLMRAVREVVWVGIGIYRYKSKEKQSHFRGDGKAWRAEVSRATKNLVIKQVVGGHGRN